VDFACAGFLQSGELGVGIFGAAGGRHPRKSHRRAPGRHQELILPDANRRDFDKLPEHIRAGFTVHFAKRYQDVAAVAFEPSGR